MHHTSFGDLLLDANDLIDAHIIQTGNWDAYQDTIYTKYIREDTIALDIGAHIGVCSLKMAALGATVHAFEPDPQTYPILVQNIAYNRANIIPYHFALGDSRKITSYGWYYPRNRGASGLVDSALYGSDVVQKNIQRGFGAENNGVVNPVFMTTLDSLGLLHVDFIKIDTEGCDFKVLIGGESTIRRCKPVILYEAEPEVSTKIRAYIEGLGYSVTHVDKTDYLAVPL